MVAHAAHRSRPIRRHENGTPYEARIAMLAGVAAPATSTAASPVPDRTRMLFLPSSMTSSPTARTRRATAGRHSGTHGSPCCVFGAQAVWHGCGSLGSQDRVLSMDSGSVLLVAATSLSVAATVCDLVAGRFRAAVRRLSTPGRVRWQARCSPAAPARRRPLPALPAARRAAPGGGRAKRVAQGPQRRAEQHQVFEQELAGQHRQHRESAGRRRSRRGEQEAQRASADAQGLARCPSRPVLDLSPTIRRQAGPGVAQGRCVFATDRLRVR